jgi:hypothetical protein
MGGIDVTLEEHLLETVNGVLISFAHVTDDIIINVKAVEFPKYTITYDLTGCELENMPQEVYQGSSY